MKIKIDLFYIFLILFFLCQSPCLFAAEKIKIVTTTSTLASITKEIAYDKVDVYSIASPKQNIHFYAPTPRNVLKVKKSEVLVHQGLDLEAWRGPLLNAAGNPRFLGGGNFSIDVSKGISLLEVPTSLSRAEGDIHLYGNPHYVVDPENAKIMATNISEGLAKAFPQDADYFRKNTEAFNRKLDEKIKDWLGRMASYKETPIVTYHRSWSCFAERFGFVIVGEVEPKPGIPPTAKHIAELMRVMKEKGVKVIIKESFQENSTPKKIAYETGAQVVTLAQAVGETKEARDYISMMEQDIQLLEQALSAKKGI